MVQNSMSNNPLSAYFRRPAIYIKLPSNGNFWPAGSLEITDNGELAVYPMTAVDEISYRTPDALFNGQALVDVVQSCIPSIKNAWDIPSIDLDTILVAIRIASYNSEMDIDTTCPKCGELSSYTLDLHDVLQRLKVPDYGSSLNVGEMRIHFRPLDYRQVTHNNILQFEEQKIVSVIGDAEMDEEQKMKILGEAFQKINNLTFRAIQEGIEYIQTPEAQVSDQEFIKEYLINCDRNVYKTIREHIINLKTESEMKPLQIVCDSCSNEYQQPFTLDMANFFE
jgi:hypothetical protein